MKEFDYIIIGGGCAGLSLAYELETHDKLKNKSKKNLTAHRLCRKNSKLSKQL